MQKLDELAHARLQEKKRERAIRLRSSAAADKSTRIPSLALVAMAPCLLSIAVIWALPRDRALAPHDPSVALGPRPRQLVEIRVSAREDHADAQA